MGTHDSSPFKIALQCPLKAAEKLGPDLHMGYIAVVEWVSGEHQTAITVNVSLPLPQIAQLQGRDKGAGDLPIFPRRNPDLVPKVGTWYFCQGPPARAGDQAESSASNTDYFTLQGYAFGIPDPRVTVTGGFLWIRWGNSQSTLAQPQALRLTSWRGKAALKAPSASS